MALDPATITLFVRLGTDLITALIRAGRSNDAESVRVILGRAGANFDDVIAWSETPTLATADERGAGESGMLRAALELIASGGNALTAADARLIAQAAIGTTS